jgi:hypothetical protein
MIWRLDPTAFSNWHLTEARDAALRPLVDVAAQLALGDHPECLLGVARGSTVAQADGPANSYTRKGSISRLPVASRFAKQRGR